MGITKVIKTKINNGAISPSARSFSRRSARAKDRLSGVPSAASIG
jgi:hypothetical protein